MTRIIDFTDGFTSATEPTTEGSIASFYAPFANNAAYEAVHTTVEGSTFLDTTLDVVKVYVGATWRTTERALDNAEASSPGVSNDNTEGYEVLSLWLNTSSGAFFRATDVSTGAAAWQEIAADAVVDAHIADATAHGATGAVVGTTNTQTLTAKTFDDEVTLQEIATPSTPASGYMKVYPKTDSKFYKLDDTGAETELGAGGGGSLEIYHQEDFETTVAADFSSGNNATPDIVGTGTLDGTLSDDTTTQLSKISSLKYVMGSSSINDFFLSPAITVDELQTDKDSGFTKYYDYNGDNDDLKVIVLDQADNVLTSTLDLMEGTTTNKRFSISFFIPSTVTAIHYGVQVVTGNSGKILRMDNVEVSTNPFVYKDLTELTDWESYTPTINGGGSITVDYAKHRRVGDSLEIQARIALGTTSSSEFQLSLPNSESVAIGYSDVGVGTIYSNESSDKEFVVLATAADTFLNASYTIGTGGAGYTPQNTSTLFPSTAVININTTVKIEGWTSSSEHVVTPAKSNLTDFVSAGVVSIDAVTTAPTKGTVSVDDVIWRRVGDSMEIHYQYQQTGAGAGAGSGDYLFDIPGGYSVDTAKLAVNGSTPNVTIGHGHLTNNPDNISGSTHPTRATLHNATQFKLIRQTAGVGSQDIMGSGLLPLTNSGIGFSVYVTVPISGWTSDATFLAAIPVQKVAFIKEVQASGVFSHAAASFTSGAWRTRFLNTISGDSELVSLSSNQFTLQSGKYLIEASAPAYETNHHTIKLYNITDSTDDIIGTTGLSGGAVPANVTSTITGAITIVTSKVFEIQHQAQTTKVGGFGSTVGFGVTEIYTTVKITKLR